MKLNRILGLSNSLMEGKVLKRCWVKDAFGSPGVRPGTPGFLLEASKNPEDQHDQHDEPVAMANPFEADGPAVAVAAAPSPGGMPFRSKSATPNNILVLPFATNTNVAPRGLHSMAQRHFGLVVEPEPTTLLDEISIIHTDGLDADMVDKAVHFANTKGPLSFVLTESKGLVKELRRAIQKIKSDYKYKGSTYHNRNKILKPEPNEQIQFVISMFKPSLCMPFFGEDDGAFVSGCTYYPERSKATDGFVTNAEFSFFFTNNTEAVYHTDGSKYKISHRDISRLQEWLLDSDQYFGSVGKAGNKFGVEKKKGK